MRPTTLMALSDWQCKAALQHLYPDWFAEWLRRSGCMTEVRRKLLSHTNPTEQP